MSTEFFWRLPLGTDGPQLSTDKHNRGSAHHRPGHIAPGRLPNGEPDDFTYIDYIAQVAKAAELAGFEGALLPTGPEPWIAAAALARETRRIRFLIAFQARLDPASLCGAAGSHPAEPQSRPPGLEHHHRR